MCVCVCVCMCVYVCVCVCVCVCVMCVCLAYHSSQFLMCLFQALCRACDFVEVEDGSEFQTQGKELAQDF